MRIDPVAAAMKPLTWRSVALLAFLLAYIAFSIAVFVLWVNPSLQGTSDLRIAADSSTYLYFADTLRFGRPDPWVYRSLASFPNTLWAPVFLAFVLNSTAFTVVVNYAFFFISVLLLRKAFSFSTGTFLLLLLINPTTTISLLSVNKEIVDLLAIALFLYGRSAHRKGFILLAMFISLINRFELCALMGVFQLAESRLNPIRTRRMGTLILITLAIGIALPLFAGQNLAYRFEEAQFAGAIVWLDSLEMHYLYLLAVIPKVFENLFGVLISPAAWTGFSSSDLANSYILILNNIATAIVLGVLGVKRLLSVRNDLIYLAALGSVLMATALVIQPRYFYGVYVLLCLQAAHPHAMRRRTAPSADPAIVAA
jgi:hypothetical protein